MDNNNKLNIPECIVNNLCVPGYPSKPLKVVDGYLQYEEDGENITFPIINGTPILINEEKSIFRISTFLNSEITTMDFQEEADKPQSIGRKIKRFINSITPLKSRNVSDFTPQQALDMIFAENPDAVILVIGAGDVRFEMCATGNIVYTDVAIARDTQLIADAHDIPFMNETFQAVFANAVLEHVADPYRTVEEICRVLKSKGLVYSVTPFMQQVHMGRYDFTRFTALGHRRIFNRFDELRSGVANGPGMVVAWSLEYLVTSLFENRLMQRVFRTLSRFVVWPFLLLDGFVSRKAGAYDCASAYYFFGRLRTGTIHDRDIIEQYKGIKGL